MCWDNARVIWEMQIAWLVSGVLQNMLRISVNTPFPRKFIFRIVTSVTTFTPMEFPFLLLLPQVSAPFFNHEKKITFFADDVMCVSYFFD